MLDDKSTCRMYKIVIFSDGRQNTGRRKAEENTTTRRTVDVDDEAQAALRVGTYCNACVTRALLCMACPISG